MSLILAPNVLTQLLFWLQVKTAVDEALEWMDDNQDAEEDEYKEKLKEVEDVCNPVVSAAYAASGERS